MLDQNHRAPVARRIAGEFGPGRRAVDDIGGIESERAGQHIEKPQQPRHLAQRAGLVNDAKPAAAEPTNNADKNGSRRLIGDQRIEMAAPDAVHHAQHMRGFGEDRQVRTRIQISGLEREAVRQQPVFDDAGKLLYAAAFVIVKNLQNTHRIALVAARFVCTAPMQLNDTL